MAAIKTLSVARVVSDPPSITFSAGVRWIKGDKEGWRGSEIWG